MAAQTEKVEKSPFVEYEGRPTGGGIGMADPVSTVPVRREHFPVKRFAGMVLVGVAALYAAIQHDRGGVASGKIVKGPVVTVTGEPMSAAFPTASQGGYAAFNPIGMTPTKAQLTANPGASPNTGSLSIWQ